MIASTACWILLGIVSVPVAAAGACVVGVLVWDWRHRRATRRNYEAFQRRLARGEAE